MFAFLLWWLLPLLVTCADNDVAYGYGNSAILSTSSIGSYGTYPFTARTVITKLNTIASNMTIGWVYAAGASNWNASISLNCSVALYTFSGSFTLRGASRWTNYTGQVTAFEVLPSYFYNNNTPLDVWAAVECKVIGQGSSSQWPFPATGNAADDTLSCFDKAADSLAGSPSKVTCFSTTASGKAHALATNALFIFAGGNTCAPNPCPASNTCGQTQNGFVCCVFGWTGTACVTSNTPANPPTPNTVQLYYLVNDTCSRILGVSPPSANAVYALSANQRDLLGTYVQCSDGLVYSVGYYLVTSTQPLVFLGLNSQVFSFTALSVVVAPGITNRLYVVSYATNPSGLAVAEVQSTLNQQLLSAFLAIRISPAGEILVTGAITVQIIYPAPVVVTQVIAYLNGAGAGVTLTEAGGLFYPLNAAKNVWAFQLPSNGVFLVYGTSSQIVVPIVSDGVSPSPDTSGSDKWLLFLLGLIGIPVGLLAAAGLGLWWYMRHRNKSQAVPICCHCKAYDMPIMMEEPLLPVECGNAGFPTPVVMYEDVLPMNTGPITYVTGPVPYTF